jgi:DNA primase small subunit
MSRLESSDLLLRKLLRSHYRRRPLLEPEYLSKREIAVYSLEDKVYIRHLSFPTMKQLYDYILGKKTPLHLYYSSAYYEDPSAEDMESKGWLGSDLIFDIDVDHFEGCNNILSFCIGEGKVYEGKIKACGDSSKPIGYPLISFDCIRRGWSEARKLIEILRDDLGFKRIDMLYSGNRGFHVRVLDNEAKVLTGDHRRQIVEYLTLRNIDVNKIFPAASRGGYVYFSRQEYGWRRRVLEDLTIKGIVESVGEYKRAPQDKIAESLQGLAVNLDPVVTMDVSRLSRFPYSLHGKSGLAVYPLKPGDNLAGYMYGSFTPFNGRIKVEPLITYTGLPVLDSKINLKKGIELHLPAYQGVYLALKGLVLIKDISGVEVEDVRHLHKGF